MTKLLIHLFMRGKDDLHDPSVREAYGKFAGAVGIVTNALLCVIKIFVGLAASSLAIAADGINNLSDASSSVITLIGFHLSAKPQDQRHPYGHARIEYLTGLLISIGILLIGAFLMRSAIVKILHPQAMHLTALTFAILGISIALKIWQSVFYMNIARRIDSLTLKAAAADSRNDFVSTAVVLAGAILSGITGCSLDGWFSAAVAVFIIVSGVQLALETSSPLLGEAPDEDLVRDIVRMVKGNEGVLGIHDLIVHNYGPGKIFASLHVEVDADGDFLASHDMIDNIERQVHETLGIEFVIHMDPIRTNDPETKRLHQIIEGFTAKMPGIQNIHDLRIVPGETHTNVIFDVALYPDTSEERQQEIKEEITSLLSAVDPRYHAVITFDQVYTLNTP